MQQDQHLPLPRCPHCEIALPNLFRTSSSETNNSSQTQRRFWVSYVCQSCGGMTLTVSHWDNTLRKFGRIVEIWPTPRTVHNAIPERARTFLEQAIASIHAPAGAVMLTASAVDSMLKEKGLKTGTLYKRIDQASAEHLITAEMAEWAHEVRLDANDQRHADEEAALPDEADAQKGIDFALALAQFLFVLPSRVAQGRAKA
ncbi:DUF4145 domain-containing protein [Pseudomonas sp. NPDC086112]|uniref:DUF4145 domain-containing protein n=1 Tax=Pseudomonas sp. NPDC086112 TaxID=3364430 RepID=UPI00382C86FB